MTAGVAILFTAFVALIGSRVMTRLAPTIESLRLSKPFFNIGLILCLGLSVASIYVGVAAIIGAFLAGMARAEATEKNRTMHKLTSGITDFCTVLSRQLGCTRPRRLSRDVDRRARGDHYRRRGDHKIVGCGLGAWGMTRREMAQVGSECSARRGRIVVAQIVWVSE